VTLLKKRPEDRKRVPKNLRSVMIEPSRYENTPSLYDTDFSRTSASAAMLKNMRDTITANGDYVAMPGEFPVTNRDGSINLKETLKDLGFDSTTQSMDQRRYVFDNRSERLGEVNNQFLKSGDRKALNSLIFNRAKIFNASSAKSLGYTESKERPLKWKIVDKLKSPEAVEKFMRAERNRMERSFEAMSRLERRYRSAMEMFNNGYDRYYRILANRFSDRIYAISRNMEKRNRLIFEVTGFRPDTTYVTKSMSYRLNPTESKGGKSYPDFTYRNFMTDALQSNANPGPTVYPVK
jgi:hypothetical protein